MSGRRDWDKVRRHRQAYQHGTLPAWSDGWGAGGQWEPANLSIVTRPPQTSDKNALRDIDGTEIPLIGSWSKSARAYIKALGLKGPAINKRCAAIMRRNAAKARPPQVSEKRTLEDIDGTEFPLIGSWTKSAKAHIKALGLTGSAAKERCTAILRRNTAKSSRTTD